MRNTKAQSGAQRRTAEPTDPAFVNTETAGALLGQSGRSFRDRWSPDDDGWVFHYGGTRYVIPNCPNGTRRRVPVAHIHAIRNGLGLQAS